MLFYLFLGVLLHVSAISAVYCCLAAVAYPEFLIGGGQLLAQYAGDLFGITPSPRPPGPSPETSLFVPCFIVCDFCLVLLSLCSFFV